MGPSGWFPIGLGVKKIRLRRAVSRDLWLRLTFAVVLTGICAILRRKQKRTKMLLCKKVHPTRWLSHNFVQNCREVVMPELTFFGGSFHAGAEKIGQHCIHAGAARVMCPTLPLTDLKARMCKVHPLVDIRLKAPGPHLQLTQRHSMHYCVAGMGRYRATRVACDVWKGVCCVCSWTW